MNITTSQTLTAASLGLHATKQRAWVARQATGAGRIESAYSLGTAGQLIYVVVESRDGQHVTDHWEHVLPQQGGRQAFHSIDRDLVALKLIEARVASIPAAFEAARAARRAAH